MVRKEKIDSIIVEWERKVVRLDDECKEKFWQVLAEDIDNMIECFEESKKEGWPWAPHYWMTNEVYRGTTLKEWRALLSWVNVQGFM